MLQRSDKERLATLEAHIPWIRGSLGRIELGDKERSKALERHLRNHPNGNGNGGSITVVLGRKTLTALVMAILGGGGGIWALLQNL